jgi:hypothetical protein
MPYYGQNETGELKATEVSQGLLENKLPAIDKNDIEPQLPCSYSNYLLVVLAPPEFQTGDEPVFLGLVLPSQPEPIGFEPIPYEPVILPPKTKDKKSIFGSLLFKIPLALAGIIGLLDIATGFPITKLIHHIGSSEQTPPAIVKIDENEVRKLLVSTVLDFANAGCNEISIEIPMNSKLKTGPMINEAMDKANKGKPFRDMVFFKIRIVGPKQPRPLTKEDAILQKIC